MASAYRICLNNIATVFSVSDRRPDLGSERSVILGRDTRRSGQPAQVSQENDVNSTGCGEGASLLHGV